MTNESNNEIEQTRAAYMAGRDAIVKKLGKNASMDDLAEVVLLLAHSILTGFEQLDLNASVQNADIFNARLKLTIEDTQKNVAPSGYVGRLM